MRSRGRPPKTTGDRRYPSRLRELRTRHGLSQRQVSTQAGISLAYYGALERGDKRINAEIAGRLQVPLRCAAGELLAGTAAVSVPLRYVVAAAESEARPESFELPEPYEWLPAGRLADPQHCFAAEIVDDSADVDFAKGTLLYLRPLTMPAAAPQVGARIVARFFFDAGEERRTHEVLYGVLDQNVLGDLVLITRTANRLIPRHALIQAAPPGRNGLAEAPLVIRRQGAAIAYLRRADDPAEILGVVVYAAGPA